MRRFAHARTVRSTDPLIGVVEAGGALPDAEAQLRTILELEREAAALEANSLERVLSRRELELSEFIDNAVEGMHKIGPDGRILSVNKAELELLGYTAEEYVGHWAAEFSAEAAAGDEILARLLRGERLRDYPATLRCKDRSLKHVLLYSNALWEDGKFVHTHCSTRDVTERTRLEVELRAKIEELAEGARRKDEFLAMLGHELRNPLAPIMLGVKLVRSHSGPDVSHRHLDTIERQTEKLTRLVDDLLDVSRITRGRIELRTEPLDVATAMTHAMESTRPLMEQRHHTVSVTLPARPIAVLADPIRLEQILVNLLVNAAKYTEEGGRISLTAAPTAAGVELCVRDSGMGIAPEMLERIFDLFNQIDRSLDRAQGGLGIGLTIARTLVEMHGGTISAGSEGENRGTAFTVCLPVIADGTPAHRALAPAPIWGTELGRLRILVVDDNADAADTLASFLGDDLGQEVRIAHDGPTALEVASAFRPQVILLDIGLPGMDGYEVARRLQSAQSDAVLVALTGYDQREDRRRTTAAGFSAHLAKPISLELLMKILKATDRSAGKTP